MTFASTFKICFGCSSAVEKGRDGLRVSFVLFLPLLEIYTGFTDRSCFFFR